MTLPNTPPQHLEREFLPVRAKILEIAAALDRIQRTDEKDADDQRWEQLMAGIRLLQSQGTDRAEQVQLLFSRPFDQQWRESIGISIGE